MPLQDSNKQNSPPPPPRREMGQQLTLVSPRLPPAQSRVRRSRASGYTLTDMPHEIILQVLKYLPVSLLKTSLKSHVIDFPTGKISPKVERRFGINLPGLQVYEESCVADFVQEYRPLVWEHRRAPACGDRVFLATMSLRSAIHTASKCTTEATRHNEVPARHLDQT